MTHGPRQKIVYPFVRNTACMGCSRYATILFKAFNFLVGLSGVGHFVFEQGSGEPGLV
ncbi:hypothetical protein BDV38DRAFT_240151 [Aspergillus pseudotamarii]|uniref:Uncharacterized protein n=1 Tax=Aspergillus pseudotamarii TaxID=132259 RepID=A0A5N6SZW5_ASPPS|nr:uncharacterized protein BDV38DRAFT_240151 [Aspergillus pseudotamarii]KAE8140172.1 hypothetical protein BDV38DRAFT_240151 [Aspergillus pseudotamarii]